MSGESLIIAWEIPKEFRVKNEKLQWARDLKKEMKQHKRGQWAYVYDLKRLDVSSTMGINRAAEKVFGFLNVKWEVSSDKLYVRLPWWRL